MASQKFPHTFPVGYIFRNGNGMEVVVVAYLDCIHELIYCIHREHSVLPSASA